LLVNFLLALGLAVSPLAALANPTEPVFVPKPGLLSDQKILEVHQNPESGSFTIRAHKISRSEILQKISEMSGLTIQSFDDEILKDPFNVDLADMPLKQIVNLLVEDVNSVFIYSSDDEVSDENTKLVKVLMISRKEGMPTGLKAIEQIDQDESAETQDELQIVLNSHLGRALLGNNPFATKRILKALMETGTKYEKKMAVEDIGQIMADPAFYDQANTGHLFQEALDALKQLNPARGEAFLTDLLQNGEEAWVQSLAAQSLGEFGLKSSVDPLLAAFGSDNTLVRDAAINSLAKIGNDQGINQLLQAISTGDSNLQQLIVNAMAYAGDANTQAALNQAIASNQIPVEAVSEDVLHQLAQQKGPANSSD